MAPAGRLPALWAQNRLSPQLFKMASAMMLRAELPVHKNKTLKHAGFFFVFTLFAIATDPAFRPRRRRPENRKLPVDPDSSFQ